MSFNAFLFQALNGLSTASGLFFVAVGLSLIFGVSRIINIAHGSLYMLGTYIAYSFATKSAARWVSGAASWRPRSWSALIGASSRSCCCGASIARPNCSNCSRPSRWCW